MGSLGAKSLPPFIIGSRGSRAGPNARQAPLRNGREHHTTSDAYRAWKTRGDASFSSIPGLNGFSHGAPERPENQEALPLWKPQFGVETSLPQPSWGQAHFPWKRSQCYLNCGTGPMGSWGPTWVGVAWNRVMLKPPFSNCQDLKDQNIWSLSAASCCSGREQGGSGTWQPQSVCLCLYFNVETGLCPESRLGPQRSWQQDWLTEKPHLSQLSLPTHPCCPGRL